MFTLSAANCRRALRDVSAPGGRHTWLVWDASATSVGGDEAKYTWRLPMPTTLMPPMVFFKPSAAALMTATDLAATELDRPRLKPAAGGCGELLSLQPSELKTWEFCSACLRHQAGWARWQPREQPVAIGAGLSEARTLQTCSPSRAPANRAAVAAHSVGLVTGEWHVVEHFESSPSRSETQGSREPDLLGGILRIGRAHV